MGKRLYVRNLAPSVDAYSLEDLFNTVGDVESVLIEPDPLSQRGLSLAYVEMRTADAALDCIVRFNGHEIGGAYMIVTKDTPHVPDPNFISPARKKALAAKKEKKARA